MNYQTIALKSRLNYDLNPLRLKLDDCPDAPKKENLKIERDIDPQPMFLDSPTCPNAPKRKCQFRDRKGKKKIIKEGSVAFKVDDIDYSFMESFSRLSINDYERRLQNCLSSSIGRMKLYQ